MSYIPYTPDAEEWKKITSPILRTLLLKEEKGEFSSTPDIKIVSSTEDVVDRAKAALINKKKMKRKRHSTSRGQARKFTKKPVKRQGKVHKKKSSSSSKKKRTPGKSKKRFGK